MKIFKDACNFFSVTNEDGAVKCEIFQCQDSNICLNQLQPKQKANSVLLSKDSGPSIQKNLTEEENLSEKNQTEVQIVMILDNEANNGTNSTTNLTKNATTIVYEGNFAKKSTKLF